MSTLIPFLLLAFVGLKLHSLQSHSRQLQQQTSDLVREVTLLQRKEAMSGFAVSKVRGSICYIVGVYSIDFGGEPAKRIGISGSGFVVADGLIATNRHVAQPWYQDGISDALVRAGAKPRLEKLVAYFPFSPSAVDLLPGRFSQKEDVAVVRIATTPTRLMPPPLPLASTAPQAGDPVTIVGYPMGAVGMAAKAPAEILAVLKKQALLGASQGAATNLATLSLIRPLATYGRLGDILGDKLVYDAPTAHGGSGGPVFNSQGEVIAINSAYIEGFSGESIGISSDTLKPLIARVEHCSAQCSQTK